MLTTPLIRGHRLPLSVSQFAAICALSASVAPVYAQSIVVPKSLSESTTSGSTIPVSQTAVTYMGYVDATQFSSLTTPVVITGLQFRLSIDASNVATSYPSTTLSFTNYSIELARGSTALETAGDFSAATTSTTFASFQQGVPVDVKTGALTVTANAYPFSSSGTTQTFGATITFTTPYTYTPGQSLTYLIRESGYTPTTVGQAGFASTTYANKVTDAIDAMGNATATSPTSTADPLFVAFQYTSASVTPEPAAAGLLIAGFAARSIVSLRRRRRNV